MKFSIVAALIVVLALAQGSLSAEVPLEEQVRQQLEAFRAKLVSTTSDLAERINVQELTAQAQTHLEPLATQIKTIATNLQEQLKPMADDMQARIKPMVDSFQSDMQEMFNRLMDQVKAINAGTAN